MEKEWKDKAFEMADERIIAYSGKTLCANYRNALMACDNINQAARLYKSCISWALLERYPTKEELLDIANGDKAVLAKNGIFIDTLLNGELIDDFLCCVFLSCTGSIRVGLNVEKAIVPKLYLSEGTRLSVEPITPIIGKYQVELYYDSHIETKALDAFSIYDYNKHTIEENKGLVYDENKEIRLDSLIFENL